MRGFKAAQEQNGAIAELLQEHTARDGVKQGMSSIICT
jgi:hypothetical protein